MAANCDPEGADGCNKVGTSYSITSLEKCMSPDVEKYLLARPETLIPNYSLFFPADQFVRKRVNQVYTGSTMRGAKRRILCRHRSAFWISMKAWSAESSQKMSCSSSHHLEVCDEDLVQQTRSSSPKAAGSSDPALQPRGGALAHERGIWRDVHTRSSWENPVGATAAAIRDEKRLTSGQRQVVRAQTADNFGNVGLVSILKHETRHSDESSIKECPMTNIIGVITALCAIALSHSVSAQQGTSDFEAPVTSDFISSDIRFTGEFGIVYEYRWQVTAIEGFLVVCGVGALTESRMRQTVADMLEEATVVLDDQPIFSDISFFGQAATPRRLANGMAVCRFTGVTVPRDASTVGIRFEAASFRN
jgi:hypothetical protein